MNTTGTANVAVGANALDASNADYCTAIGRSVLGANTTGTQNTDVGSNAM